MRSIAEMRADLANTDRSGMPWPSAAKRLLTDMPALVSALERVEALMEHPLTSSEYGEAYVTFDQLREALRPPGSDCPLCLDPYADCPEHS